MGKKIVDRSYSKTACYELNGICYSAFQRREVIERIEYDDYTTDYKIVGRWE